jgi:hypothetical protein
MPRSPKPEQSPTYHLPATVELVSVVAGQAISVQSLLDLAAVSRPTPRPDWTDLLLAAARLQQSLADRDWTSLGLALGTLVLQMGLQLDAREASAAIQLGIDQTGRYGAETAMAVLAHRLCRLAVQ